jgi:hypothetical protein
MKSPGTYASEKFARCLDEAPHVVAVYTATPRSRWAGPGEPRGALTALRRSGRTNAGTGRRERTPGPAPDTRPV